MSAPFFIYSINRKTIRPVWEPFTHLACEEGQHKSVEFTLLRTGGITKQKFHFREVYKALGFGRHKADILRYTHHSYLPFRDVALQYRQRQSCLDYQ